MLRYVGQLAPSAGESVANQGRRPVALQAYGVVPKHVNYASGLPNIYNPLGARSFAAENADL